ncbi:MULTISPECIES: MerR family transcriptional regulator [Tissierellales]|jgi:DNA-binding transcriptional MerR regulator|uniref:MerR family transcriptional regulator n=1 Tax=Acidilutibacter cellobiosedens TaxID=2507161 RepID=A0A410QCQ9_9FIRM|nr:MULTISPECIES: MerR family transcriptional regulator [Tissierellales]MBE6082029.1 MerR family transcriptional regulator [Tissierellaceae bacterium]QAT61709.1 MerR family transcriptional regulator [Acidilutibacter cellobiosedens]SCL82625.1 zinc-responsive transcriptional regulator [Sporanaerobacter sp. PP17-6a]
MLETDKEYTISEVSETTGYPPHVLRYYEKEFVLDIPRNESNHRYYTYKEIELFQYIKSLQEKGFSNKQIKLIIKTPQMMMSDQDETAITSIVPNKSFDVANIDTTEISKEISGNVQQLLLEELVPILKNGNEHSINTINELKEEIIMLRNEINSKERDVLICENAKLKMKVKEKSYEVAELKEKINRRENSESNFFKRIFKFGKNE